MDALRTTSLVAVVAIAAGALVWTYAPRHTECPEPANTVEIRKLEQQLEELNHRVDEAVRNFDRRHRGRL